jgi:hypothetical protein
METCFTNKPANVKETGCLGKLSRRLTVVEGEIKHIRVCIHPRPASSAEIMHNLALYDQLVGLLQEAGVLVIELARLMPGEALVCIGDESLYAPKN